MFLLGTKLGQAATKTEVKYEGQNRISVTEQREDNIVLPGIGSPPFAPSFFHQGSNFFFNPQFMMPGGIAPIGIERTIAPFQPPIYGNNINIANPEVASDIIIEREPIVEVIAPELPPMAIPQFEIEDCIQTMPQVQVETKRQPIEIPIGHKLPSRTFLPKPPVRVLVEEPYKLPEPCDDIAIIPGNIIPGAPISIEREEPFQPSLGLYVSEEFQVSELPSPPELPPLIISDIPKPVVVQENKRVILIPSAPALESFYAPVMVAEKQLIPMDCAQDIIFERVLPNIAYENGKMIELISIPATKRLPQSYHP